MPMPMAGYGWPPPTGVPMMPNANAVNAINGNAVPGSEAKSMNADGEKAADSATKTESAENKPSASPNANGQSANDNDGKNAPEEPSTPVHKPLDPANVSAHVDPSTVSLPNNWPYNTVQLNQTGQSLNQSPYCDSQYHPHRASPHNYPRIIESPRVPAGQQVPTHLPIVHQIFPEDDPAFYVHIGHFGYEPTDV
jgi:hypothetical protein